MQARDDNARSRAEPGQWSPSEILLRVSGGVRARNVLEASIARVHTRTGAWALIRWKRSRPLSCLPSAKRALLPEPRQEKRKQHLFLDCPVAHQPGTAPLASENEST